MSRSWARIALLRFLVGALVVGLLSLAASVAIAEEHPVYQPPSETVSEPPLPEGLAQCPAEPGEYEGEDALAAELRANRAEQVEVCEAVTQRQEQLLERQWWLTAEAVDAREQRSLSNEKLTSLVQRLDSPLAVEWEEAQPVQESGAPAASEELVASVDASGEAVKEAVWFLAGLAVALFAGYGLYRQVMPRA